MHPEKMTESSNTPKLPEQQPARLSLSPEGAPLWKKTLFSLAEKAIGVQRLRRAYEGLKDDGRPFFRRCLEHQKVSYEVTGPTEVPREGGLLIVSNHPFGAIEGILLGDHILKYRKDLKILANGWLGLLPEMKPYLIDVAPFENRERENAKGMIQAMRWMREGHVLLVFPAGEVSSYSLSSRRVEDPRWSPHITRLMKKSQVQVMPMFIEGHNSWRFQSMGLIHPRLRTVMLVRELMNKRGKHFQIRSGQPLGPEAWSRFANNQLLLDFLRHRTYSLKQGNTTSKRKSTMPSKLSPIVPPVSPEILNQEIESLPAESLLLERDGVQVRVTPSAKIPNLLREIGRLREVTFRQAGEGSGKAIDMDHYDEKYLHLFTWHVSEKRIIGAYRLGITKDILSQQGDRGLYSNSLFRLSPTALKELGDGLELGRSFIRLEDQRERHGLPLLWKGILRYVVQNPKIRKLFGCVSICSEYQQASVDVMVNYLEKHRKLSGSESWTSPVTPYFPKKSSTWCRDIDIGDPEELSQVIAMLEPDGKGIPTLLRHYLRCGARILSFNIDREFSNVIDGLVVVDLDRADRTVIRKFMGEDGYKSYFGDETASPTEVS